MGLRFRRSIKLCKGVRLNFGKTGASISLGGNGFRKTFHTSGKVTTSVGIPGTGIYWTESTNRNNRNSRTSHSNTFEQTNDNINRDDINEYEYDDFSDFNVNNEIEDNNYSPNRSSNLNSCDNDVLDNSIKEEIEPIELIMQIKNISQKSDIFIDWSEIAFSNSNEDVLLDEDLWHFCKNKADYVLDGSIDAYLDVIEYIKPLDDLVQYAGDFEFGTDNPNIMYTEIRILLEDGNELIQNKRLFEEYTATISVKVAKDLLSLLPVTYVHIKALYENDIIFNFQIDRKHLEKIKYNIDFSISDFIRSYLR